MPNHCENDLYISGPIGAVDALLAAIGADKAKPEFNTDAVCPYPKEYQDLDDAAQAARGENPPRHIQDGFNQGGYEWCVAMWGTKWPPYNVIRRDYNGSIILSFLTAWTPPKELIIALAKAHPQCTLRLEYFEMGSGFAGGFTCFGEDDWEHDGHPFVAGEVTREWDANYRGPRGG